MINPLVHPNTIMYKFTDSCFLALHLTVATPFSFKSQQYTLEAIVSCIDKHLFMPSLVVALVKEYNETVQVELCAALCRRNLICFEMSTNNHIISGSYINVLKDYT